MFSGSSASAPKEREGPGEIFKGRARLEMAGALCAGILGVLTIFWRDWIEILTGWDPDNHSGAVEWIVVVGLLVAAVAMGLAARRHWRLPTAVPGK
jgi:hypothetical protein